MTTAGTRKKPVVEDWHPADVVAALHKKGWSLQQLAAVHGYASRTAVAHALHRPYPKAEGIIAEALQVQAKSIWPSRYNADGSSNRTPGSKPMRPDHIRIVTKATTATRGGNRQNTRSA